MISPRNLAGLIGVVLAIQAACLLLYHNTVAAPPSKRSGLAVVDLQEVYRAKEIAFNTTLKAAIGKDDGEAAIVEAQKFALALPIQMAALSADCKCIVLLKNAVGSAAGVSAKALPDLTPLLRKKLGLD